MKEKIFNAMFYLIIVSGVFFVYFTLTSPRSNIPYNYVDETISEAAEKELFRISVFETSSNGDIINTEVSKEYCPANAVLTYVSNTNDTVVVHKNYHNGLIKRGNYYYFDYNGNSYFVNDDRCVFSY